MSKTYFFELLLSTAYRENNVFVDMIDSVEKLQSWFTSIDFPLLTVTDEMVFNLQNVRHMMKKIINAKEKETTRFYAAQ